MQDAVRICRLAAVDEAAIAALAGILVDCVDGGASVSFLRPMPRAKAEAFWRAVAAGVSAGERALLVAEDAAGAIVGAVQIVLAQPDNQSHRADIAKLLVHRKARRMGAGAALMRAAEATAADERKTLLVLDTATGSDAERLYQRLGWQLCGRIPDYALTPDGELTPTTIFYKRIAVPR